MAQALRAWYRLLGRWDAHKGSHGPHISWEQEHVILIFTSCWWWTGRPGMLQFMGSQRVGHDWATELNWTEARKDHPPYHKFRKTFVLTIILPLALLAIWLTLISFGLLGLLWVVQFGLRQSNLRVIWISSSWSFLHFPVFFGLMMTERENRCDFDKLDSSTYHCVLQLLFSRPSLRFHAHTEVIHADWTIHSCE